MTKNALLKREPKKLGMGRPPPPLFGQCPKENVFFSIDPFPNRWPQIRTPRCNPRHRQVPNCNQFPSPLFHDPTWQSYLPNWRRSLIFIVWSVTLPFKNWKKYSTAMCYTLTKRQYNVENIIKTNHSGDGHVSCKIRRNILPLCARPAIKECVNEH